VKVGDLVMDKRLDDLCVVADHLKGFVVLFSLKAGIRYPVPDRWKSELKVISESR
jgi:hypothetical protein